MLWPVLPHHSSLRYGSLLRVAVTNRLLARAWPTADSSPGASIPRTCVLASKQQVRKRRGQDKIWRRKRVGRYSFAEAPPPPDPLPITPT